MKEFYCRKHLRNPFKTFVYSIIYISIFFVIFGIIAYLTIGLSTRVKSDFNTVYWGSVSLFIILIFFMFLLIYAIYFRKFKNTKVILDDDKIIYFSRNNEISIRFDEIESVSCSHFKYSRGWIKIKSKDKSIRLTVAIENIAIFIKEFKEKLDSKGYKNVYNSKRMYDFYKTATYSDDSWERIYELLKFIPPFVGVDIVIAFIFSFLVEELDIKLIMISLLLIFPVMVLIVSEVILAVKHTIELKKEQYIIRTRDYQYEHRVFDAVFVILFIMLAILLIYFAIKY